MQDINILNLSDVHTWIWTIDHRKAGQTEMEWLDRMLIRHVFTNGAALIPVEPAGVRAGARDIETANCTVFRFVPDEHLQRECELVLEWLTHVDEREPTLAERVTK
jgi:hypothetical protein